VALAGEARRGGACADRRAQQRIQTIDRILRRLHGQIVDNPVRGTQPEAGEVCEVPAVDTKRSVVTSLGFKPSCCSCVRSIFSATVG